jgi:hypothetical protein
MPHEQPSDADVARVSKLLFGNRWRLAVAAHIADDATGRLSVRAVARELGCADSVVLPLMRSFKEAGLLDGPTRDVNELRYTRLPHAFWELARTVHDDVRAMSTVPEDT